MNRIAFGMSFVGAAALAPMVLPTSGNASQVYVAPAAICQGAAPAGTPDEGTLIVARDGTMWNFHASYQLEIVCGLHENDDTSSSTTDDVVIYMYDGHTTGASYANVSCGAYSCNWDLSTCNEETVVYGDADGSGSAASTFQGDGYINLLDLDKPSYHRVGVYCLLPDVQQTYSFIKTVYYSW